MSSWENGQVVLATWQKSLLLSLNKSQEQDRILHNFLGRPYVAWPCAAGRLSRRGRTALQLLMCFLRHRRHDQKRATFHLHVPRAPNICQENFFSVVVQKMGQMFLWFSGMIYFQFYHEKKKGFSRNMCSNNLINSMGKLVDFFPRRHFYTIAFFLYLSEK